MPDLKFLARITTLSCLLTIVPPVYSQTAETASSDKETGLQEIVVTARKREESVQGVPVAVTAITGEALKDRNIADVQSLTQTIPNVNFSNSDNEARITIRGIGFDSLAGSSGEARVAYHEDGVYLARTGNIYGTFFDIDRVEVLRGPQGTLFGRNAVAGTVNVVTRDPTDKEEGYVQGDFGDYNQILLQAAVGGALTEGVSGRMALRTETRDGYDYNVPHQMDVNNVDNKAFRAKLKIEPSSSFSIMLSADYFTEKDRQGFILLGLNNPVTNPVLPAELEGGVARDGNPRHDYSDYLSSTFRDYWGLSATVSWDLGKQAKLISITSYRKGTENFGTDLDATTLPLAFNYVHDTSRTITEEVRLQGDRDWGAFVVGGYYYADRFDEKSIDPVDLLLIGASTTLSGLRQGIDYGGIVDADAFAFFTQATYDITQSFNITGGVRYSWENKKKQDEYYQFSVALPYTPGIGQPIAPAARTPNESNTYHNVSPLATLKYVINDANSVYATYTKGFKSGGYNLGYGTPGYFPETLTDYEVGLKSDLFNRHLRMNWAAFDYNYDNLQVSRANQISNLVVNAASAKLYGVELEAEAVLGEGLKVDGAASFMRSYFTEFNTFDPSRLDLGNLNLAGNRLPNSPKYTFSYGAQYSWHTPVGEWTVRGEGRTISSIYFDQFNVASNSQGGFSNYNAMLNWKGTDDKFYGSLYVRNICNGLNKNGDLVFAGITGFNIMGQYNPPRTFGVTAGVRF